MGVCLKKLGRYGEAIDAYQQALEIDSKSSLAWENLGIVQALNRQLDLAEKNIRESADRAGTTERDCEYPWRNLAAIALHSRDPEVESYLEHALTCNHQHSDSLCLRAKMNLEWAGHENFEQALIDAGHADFTAAGKSPRARRMLALAHLRNGNYEEAITHAEVANSLPGALVSANQLIASIALARLGNMDEARVMLGAAMTSWPSDFEQVAISAEKGILWFESPRTLELLRTEAEDLIERR